MMVARQTRQRAFDVIRNLIANDDRGAADVIGVDVVDEIIDNNDDR